MASPAEIFRREKDLESFRAAVTALEGDFDFGAADMIALGEAYFERHPERSVGRDASGVLLGYALVRSCVAEKIIKDLPPASRTFYRAVFQDVSQAGPRIDARRDVEGVPEMRREAGEVRAALDAVKRTIEEIPKGMIRERFIGGISNLYNILYVVAMKLGAL
jgi:hypothetical protein